MPKTCILPAHAKLAFSIKQLCEATSLGKQIVEDEIGEGRLVAVKVRRRTLILRPDAERWLAGLLRRPATTLPGSNQPGGGGTPLGQGSGPQIPARKNSRHFREKIGPVCQPASTVETP